MGKVLGSLSDRIGRTPIVRLNRFGGDLEASIFAKLEYLNPFGSIKDRVVLSVIRAAERQGEIDRDTTIVEASTGNTGLSLAYLCAERGYRLILTMPEVIKEERKRLLGFLGVEVVFTPPSEGMGGAIRKAEELVEKIPKAFRVDLFRNPANPEAHRKTTAEEIWEDMAGKVDAVVIGVGTGGTITGVGEVLKGRKPSMKVIAVEPEESAVLSGRPPGSHGIYGIGPGFIPPLFNREIVDMVVTVSTEEAWDTTKALARREGIFCGVSSGAVLNATLKVAKEFKNKNIVAILPDGGERYIHTRLMDN